MSDNSFLKDTLERDNEVLVCRINSGDTLFDIIYKLWDSYKLYQRDWRVIDEILDNLFHKHIHIPDPDKAWSDPTHEVWSTVAAFDMVFKLEGYLRKLAPSGYEFVYETWKDGSWVFVFKKQLNN